MNKRLILLNIIILSVILYTLPYVNAKENNSYLDKYLRVGLKQYYENLSSIHIENDSIKIGYMLEDKWKEEVKLSSPNGFTILPAANYYLISDKYYYTFEDINYVVNQLKKSGVNAYPGNVSPGIWKVYVGNFNSNDEANIAKENIDGTLDLEYEILDDNGYRTILEYGNDNIIILENSYQHSCFMSNRYKESIPIIDLGKRSYRGIIEIGRYNKTGITAINVISIDEYLYGVLPSEMNVNWPLEALKAQAVAARNYAIYYGLINPKYIKEPYNICDTVYSQVYKGYEYEDNRTNQAIDETKNKLLYYNDQVIPTYFFSTSGGKTESSENVWSNKVPYLKSVPDIYETSPEKEPWLYSLTPSEIKNMLNEYDINIGSIVNIEVTEYSESGRALGLKIVGTNGDYTLAKETMRYWLGLYSRKFDLVKSDYKPQTKFHAVNSNGDISKIDIKDVKVINGLNDLQDLKLKEQLLIMSNENIENYPTIYGEKNKYIFAGQGWGHGIGMSQSGAKGMALAGYKYDEILEYYYFGTKVK